MTDLFKDRAEDYDARDIPQRLSAGIGAAIAERVPLHEGLSVMDFGAGTGLVTGRIADKVGRVTAVDVSRSMLDKLAAPEVHHAGFERDHRQRLLEKHGLRGVSFTTAVTVQRDERTYPVFLVVATKA